MIFYFNIQVYREVNYSPLTRNIYIETRLFRKIIYRSGR